MGAQTELWLRILATVFSLLLVSAGASQDASKVLNAASIEDLRKAWEWTANPAHFLGARSSVILDFLFLLAHGFLFRFLFRTYAPSPVALRLASLMMAVDIAENIALLFLLDQVAWGEGAFKPAHVSYVSFYVLKWSAVAATYWLAGRIHWLFRVASVCALLLMIVEFVGWDFASGIGSLLGASMGGALLIHAVRNSNLRDVSLLLFAIRVPLLTLAVCASYTMLALGPLRAFLLSTLFFYSDTSGWLSVVLTSILGFLGAQAIAIHASTVLRLGPARFPIVSLQDPELQSVLRLLLNAAYACVAFTMFTGAIYTSGPWTTFHLAVLLGFAVALAIVAAADLSNAYLADRPPKGKRPNLFLILPSRIQRSWLAWVLLILKKPAPKWFGRLRDKLIVKGGFPGYVENGFLRAEHVYALLFLLLAGLLYIAILVWVFHWRNKPPLTIASIFLLLLILSSIFNGLTFFGDRYRIPAVLLLVIASAVFELGHESDYFFRTMENKEKIEYKTPQEILESYNSKHPILVAASGGGIQAAAWMTTVLSNLEKDQSIDIKSRVALISGVSGGSIGAYHLGVNWENWQKAAYNSRQSSLGPIAVALAGPDFFHPILTLSPFGYVDRGYALEEAIQLHSGAEQSSVTMDEWAGRAGGQFPAMLFNATSAETGAPVTFATSVIPSSKYAKEVENPLTGKHIVRSWKSFIAASKQPLRKQNLMAASAARLSATFPYVSPSTRPMLECRDEFRYHFVDGGYYDNYGLVALSQWLDDALHSGAKPCKSGAKPCKVTILVIRGQESQEFPGSSSEPRSKQFSAPVRAFLNMRDYAQWQGIDAAIRLLQHRWKDEVQIETVPIVFPSKDFLYPLCGEPPLTWKLTPTQQYCLDHGWDVARKNLSDSYHKLAP